jgi:hypothetical protein
MAMGVLAMAASTASSRTETVRIQIAARNPMGLCFMIIPPLFLPKTQHKNDFIQLLLFSFQ